MVWMWWVIDGTRGLYSKAHIITHVEKRCGTTLCGRSVYPQIGSAFIECDDEWSKKYKQRCMRCEQISAKKEQLCDTDGSSPKTISIPKTET